MTSVRPAVYVEAPPVAPYEHGLFSVATDLPGVSGDPHWMLAGIEWESIAAVPVQHYRAGLFAGHAAAATKTLPGSPAVSRAWPTAVFAGVECGTFGRPSAEFEDRARGMVELSAQHAVEETLWAGLGLDPAASANGSVLNATGTAATLGGGLVSLVAGVALLEAWLADNYAGRGVIHARRNVAPYAAVQRLAVPITDEPGPDKAETPLGTYWSFGGGYDGTGPGGTSPAAGSAWLYVTGPVVLARSEVVVPATFAESINRSLNTEHVIAEQINLVGFDGPAAAVNVTLP